MNLIVSALAILSCISAGAADLSREFEESKQTLEAQQSQTEERAYAEAFDRARDAGWAHIAKRLSRALARKSIRVSPEQLLVLDSDSNLSVSRSARLESVNPYQTGRPTTGWAEIDVVYRRGDQLCRIVGSRRIFTSRIMNRAWSLVWPLTVVSRPECVPAAK